MLNRPGRLLNHNAPTSGQFFKVRMAATPFSTMPNRWKTTGGGVHAAFDYFRARDGSMIRCGFWRPQGRSARATVVLLHGRKEFLEKYAETISDLNQRGFEVLSLDWRGQGLSSREVRCRRAGHVRDFSEYLEDLDLFWRAHLANIGTAPVLLLGHSMGGHLALRFAHDHPERLRGAVLAAPMFDIRLNTIARKLIPHLAAAVIAAGGAALPVPGTRRRSPRHRAFAGNRLTSDPQRFRAEKHAIESNPALAVEGLTFGWLAAALRSIAILQKPGYLEAVSTPVLIVSGGQDRIVCRAAHHRVFSRMSNGRFVLIPAARHEILMERDALRHVFWQAFDAFTAPLTVDQSPLGRASKPPVSGGVSVQAH
jgi:lysophospholipase